MFFGFIQISGFCCSPFSTCDIHSGRHEDQSGGMWAGLRQAQMSAASLPMVGWSTNADRAQGCDVHPTQKQDCARRLAHSALALKYGRHLAWRSPTFRSQAAGPGGSVTIELNDVSDGGLHEVFPFNYLNTRGPSGTGPVVPMFDCAAHDKAGPGTCAWAAVQLANGAWANATIAARARSVTFTPMVSSAERAALGPPLATAYAWGSVPMMSLYDAGTGLPVLGWNVSLGRSVPRSE